MGSRTLRLELRVRNSWRWFFSPQCDLDQVPDFVVLSISSDRVVALQHTAGVSVNHENRVVAGVEKNGIRRFRADTLLRKQFGSQLLSGSPKHRVKSATIVLIQKGNKIFHPLRLLAKVTG
jgi:antirestriction protein ArdC